MPIFYVQDNDRPGYVIAKDYQEALVKWVAAVIKENISLPVCEDYTPDPPKGIQYLAGDEEIIISDDWVKSLDEVSAVSVRNLAIGKNISAKTTREPEGEDYTILPKRIGIDIGTGE